MTKPTQREKFRNFRKCVLVENEMVVYIEVWVYVLVMVVIYGSVCLRVGWLVHSPSARCRLVYNGV